MPVVKVVKRKYQYFLTCLQFFKAGKANSVGLHLLVSQRRVVRATKTAEKIIFKRGQIQDVSHVSRKIWTSDGVGLLCHMKIIVA